MKERVLNLNLKEAAEAFNSIKWKFYSVDDESKTIKIEVPRGFGESFVVEIGFANDSEKKDKIDMLNGENFIFQTVRVTSDW